MLRTPTRPRRTNPLVAAATHFETEQRRTSSRDLHSYSSWQEEAWQFFESLGEAAWAVDWLTAALSRVRLTAAEVMNGGDEPAILEEGPAAELVARLGAGVGGHGAILGAMVPQLSVPGEGWLIGEQRGGVEQWVVRSTAEIRQSTTRGARWDLREDADVWRPLDTNALVTRVHHPSPRLHYQATSSFKAALPIMRRIDLIDRRIVSTMVSRLAMNGLLLIPQEGTFSTPPQYKDAADPFVQMLVDIASNNIKNPGSASAGIPIPIRFSKDMIEKWRHLSFGDVLPQELLDERDKELRRLATALNVPAEVILGMGDTNHWNMWQIEESAIKLHVSPTAELICHALTVGFLHPMLTAAGRDSGDVLVGPNGGRIIVWYDTSELTQRPDKSDVAFRAYDRLELSGAALRRETGLDEADAPTPEETRDQILRQLARSINLGPWVIDQLGGSVTPLPDETPAGSAGGPGNTPAAEPAGDDEGGERRHIGPPDTRDDAPPPPDDGLRALLRTPDWLAATVPLADWDRDRDNRSPPASASAGSSNGNGGRRRLNGHRPRRGRR